MAQNSIFTSRLNGLQLLDTESLTIGRVRDVVILPAAGADNPRAVGLVADVQRRQIFVNLNRVSDISLDGVHLRGGTVDVRRFSRRPEEMLASELYGRAIGSGRVVDVAISPSDRRTGDWDVTQLAIGVGRGLRRRTATVVPWSEHAELFKTGPLAEQLVTLRELHPTDLASAVETMSTTRRRQLAAALEDEEVADLLEEMPEQDQIRFLAGLDAERRADVVGEMDPDDAADLLAEMPVEQRERLLAAMEAVEAADVRRLLRYDAKTAGGLMNSRPIIVSPDTPVAEVLARIRQRDVVTTTAAVVYVCEPPVTTPTGSFLGSVGFQPLLRHAPSENVGSCINETGYVRPELPESQVAARLAAYDLVSVAVCDEAGRLLGAVTVDDVLERLLPVDWRRRKRS